MATTSWSFASSTSPFIMAPCSKFMAANARKQASRLRQSRASSPASAETRHRGSVTCIEEHLAPSLITSPPAKPPASTGAAAFWHAIAPIMIPATPRAHSIRSCVREEGVGVACPSRGLCIRARTHRCLSGRRAKAFLHELGPQDLHELGHELCNLLLLSVILRIGGNRQQSLLIG